MIEQEKHAPKEVDVVPSDDWQEQEDYLEEALEETFPGSDPIAPGRPRSRKN